MLRRAILELVSPITDTTTILKMDTNDINKVAIQEVSYFK